MMSFLHSNQTGVEDSTVWLCLGCAPNAEPKIGVLPGDRVTPEALDRCVSVTLSVPPRVLGTLPLKTSKQAVAFVKGNLEALRAHWNGEWDNPKLVALLKKV